MSWLSFSDDYTGRPVWDGVPYEARWLHKCIVERCSATGRYNGWLPRSLALRCTARPRIGEHEARGGEWTHGWCWW